MTRCESESCHGRNGGPETWRMYLPDECLIWPLVYSPRRTAKNTRMIFQRATRHPLRSLLFLICITFFTLIYR